MKIVIVSDSHGEINLLRKIVNQHFDADVFLSNEKYMSTGLRCEIAGRDGNFTG